MCTVGAQGAQNITLGDSSAEGDLKTFSSFVSSVKLESVNFGPRASFFSA